MSGERPGEMRIGERLEAARIRESLDLATVEERTKIRQRYLRALEDEAWDQLPSSAYAKGFLRSYADLLGLDSEAIVDEYRRQVEVGAEPSMHPLGDRILEGRRRTPSGREGPPTWVWGAVAAVVLGAVLVAALIVGSDDPDPAGREGADEPRGDAAAADGGGGAPAADAGTIELAFRVRSPVEVCLVGGGGEALIDGQLLGAGDRERFERESFELRFPAGFEPDQIALRVAGEHRTLPRARGPAAFKLTPPDRLKRAARPGMDCP